MKFHGRMKNCMAKKCCSKTHNIENIPMENNTGIYPKLDNASPGTPEHQEVQYL